MSRCILRWAAVTAALTAAAVWATWPLATQAGRVLPGAVFAFDAYHCAYVLEWGRHALSSDPARVFDANVCYPGRQTLTSSEHYLGFAPLHALVRLATTDPLVAYEWLLVTVGVASALAMALVVHRWTRDAVAATVAGILYAFAPLKLASGAWLQVAGTMTLPLVLLAVESLLAAAPLRASVGLALLAAAQVTLMIYGSVYAAVLGTVYLGALLLASPAPRPWRRLALVPAALVTVAPLAIALARPYLAESPLVDDATSLGAALGRQAASLFPLDPLAPPTDLARRLVRLLGLARHTPPGGAVPVAVDAGRPALALALVGLATMGRRGGTTRPRALALGAVLAVGVALALGPGFLPVGPTALPLPAVVLAELPVVGGLRTPERYMLVAGVAIAAAAGVGFATLLGGRGPAPRLVAALAIVALARQDSGPLPVRPVAPLAPPGPPVRWLAEHGDGRPVLEWPAPRTIDDAARRTLEAVWHAQPTSQCFVSVYPPAWLAMLEELLTAGDPQRFAALVSRFGFGWILAREADGGLPAPVADALHARLVRRDATHALWELSGGGDVRARLARRDVTWGGVPRVPLPAEHGAHARLQSPTRAWSGEPIAVDVELANGGAVAWPTDGIPGVGLVRLELAWTTPDGARVPKPLAPDAAALLARLPGHWRGALEATRLAPLVRRALPPDVQPGEQRTIAARVAAPTRPGPYVLTATLVQDGREPATLARATAPVDVIGPRPSPP